MEREHLIEFTQVAIKTAQTSKQMLNRVMPRDNIALCAVLKIKENVYANSKRFFEFVYVLLAIYLVWLTVFQGEWRCHRAKML